MSIIGTKLGTKLELEFINSLGEKIGQTYISQLNDIIDAKNIIIAAPIHESRVMFVSSGTKSRIVFLHQKLGLVSFIATVTSKEHAENLVLLNIRIDSELEKIQRRNYFRLDCYLSASYYFQNPELTASEDTAQPDKDFKKALTKNLSGSGGCIIVEQDIPKGSNIEVVINFSSNSSIKASCVVMRNEKIETSKEKKYELGLHFTKISFKDQDTLIKFVFDQQRNKMKNNAPSR